MLARNFKTAAELRITDETYEAAVRVLGRLERGELAYHDRTGRFLDMPPVQGEMLAMSVTHVDHSCGTVACLGGWIAVEMGIPKHLIHDFVYEAAPYAMHRLFFPPEDEMTRVTPEMAAQALRNYLSAGDPGWREVLGWA